MRQYRDDIGVLLALAIIFGPTILFALWCGYYR